ncbi:MAG: hypothetical protein L0332_00455 [Chloroflexi bacterium]|nr:hypothetical protein [Chloroflexota bacterium]MCI0575985.1 hypothetical protein [Chloroflexota bacterium]MCI0648233.1 hypothetical protein [Chloroflexota bacterium]MCI0725195.1 hypothetical protein [Chloroflexota bacterium]
MLESLHLKHVGPASQFDVEFGPRLNIFTGDNGLGKTLALGEKARMEPFHFTSQTLLNGLAQNGKMLCNGLIDDWVRWQYQPDQDNASPFPALLRVLDQLSHPSEPIKPGKPTRLFIDDVRDIPTIDLPYGNVPITQASAGMHR